MTCPGFKSRLAGAQSSLGLHQLLPTGSWLAHVHVEGGCPPVFHPSKMCVEGKGHRTRVWSGIMWHVCGPCVPVWSWGYTRVHRCNRHQEASITRPGSGGSGLGCPFLPQGMEPPCQTWALPTLGLQGWPLFPLSGARRREWAPWEFQWNSRHSAFQGSRRPLEKSH